MNEAILATVGGLAVTEADLAAMMQALGPRAERYNTPEGRRALVEELCSQKLFLLDAQKNIENKGGTMRLGAYLCKLSDNTHVREIYGKREISERHRHRYEVNNDLRPALEAAGITFSGTSADGSLVEIFELNDHPWFICTQFHPEYQSKPTAAHPLFASFIAAAIHQK